MSKISSTFLMVGLAIAGLAAGYVFNNWQHQQKMADLEVSPSKETKLSSIRPLFKLKDLEGKVRDVKEWDGQVLMVNFWATWCPPCRKEIPAFVEVQEKYKDKGFTIVGVALDAKQAVVDFTNTYGVNYPILMAENEGIALSQAYGNRLGVLPFTVIIDRKGKIIHRVRSELDYKQVEAMIKPLL
ncbi:MAG: TlpA disulfide reductase family protein [Woeseiaceae bacterium]